jgi:O-methyltransferase involved in polyketide biosynthesis
MFLTRDAITATLAALSELCAPGSRLVMDYVDAAVVSGETRSEGARRVARSVAARGEPYRTGFAASDVEALFGEFGFECCDHASTPILLQRYAPEQMSHTVDSDWLAITTARR